MRGLRCSGAYYADEVKGFDIIEYIITDFETVIEDENLCQIHYIVKTIVDDKENSDLEGDFHVTSTWQKQPDGWKLVFNMDSRL